MVADGLTSVTPDGDILRVREVWADNLDEEMALIRSVVERHPFVAMDTEFPGVVARPVGNFRNSGEYHYQTLRCNVDMLKLIQLGLAFTDARGRLPRVGGELAVWQFNFREFRLGDDMYAQDSIDLLKTSGIDFNRMEGQGCDVHRFGELLMTSGVILSDDINWVTFHSGYDFGYLLKLLTCAPLPPTEVGFFELLNLYFPALYDIKYLMKFCGSLHGGLNKLAETLEVERIGPQHQAGSDSLLTAATFLKLAATFFKNNNSSNGVSQKRKGDKGESGGSGSDEGDGDGDDKKKGKDKNSSSSNGRGTGGLGHESKNSGGGRGGAPTAENVLAGLEEHRGILYGLGSDGANEAPQD